MSLVLCLPLPHQLGALLTISCQFLASEFCLFPILLSLDPFLTIYHIYQNGLLCCEANNPKTSLASKTGLLLAYASCV